MNKAELRKQALKLVGKVKTRRKSIKKACKPLKNVELLRKLKEGQNMYLSTVDREMTKWSFKRDTDVTLIMTETEHERIYKLSI